MQSKSSVKAFEMMGLEVWLKNWRVAWIRFYAERIWKKLSLNYRFL